MNSGFTGTRGSKPILWQPEAGLSWGKEKTVSNREGMVESCISIRKGKKA
jgi:hypothetical protein